MSEKKNYHHGDLRQSLINEATAMMAETGVEKLSMRGLAESVGVSRTAAYHHFKDKNELLCAIAEEGFKHWNDHFRGLLSEVPEHPEVWFQRFAVRYIDFARHHAEQYDLMFGRPVWKSGAPTPSLKECASATFHGYVNFVRRCQAEKVFSGEQDGLRIAQVTWGSLHGLSRLLNDGIYLDNESIQTMCQCAASLFVPNIASKSNTVDSFFRTQH